MSRYIDADKLKKEGWHLVRSGQSYNSSYIEGMDLDCVPTADVTEVKRGRWVDNTPSTDEYGNPLYMCADRWRYIDLTCSVCGRKATIKTNYCPNCGAKMTEEAKNEEID